MSLLCHKKRIFCTNSSNIQFLWSFSPLFIHSSFPWIILCFVKSLFSPLLSIIHMISIFFLVLLQFVISIVAGNVASCDDPCVGGACLFRNCEESASCKGGACKFINCFEPICEGGSNMLLLTIIENVCNLLVIFSHRWGMSIRRL